MTNARRITNGDMKIYCAKCGRLTKRTFSGDYQCWNLGCGNMGWTDGSDEQNKMNGYTKA